MNALRLFLLLTTLTTVLSAQDNRRAQPSITLAAASQSWTAGGTAEIAVTFANPRATALPFSPPDVLSATLRTAQGQAPVELRALDVAAPRTLAPFAKTTHPYAVELPVDLSAGRAALILATPAEPVLLTTIEAQPATAQAEGSPDRVEAGETRQAPRKFDALGIPIAPAVLNQIRPYEPIYFSLGFRDQLNAKFQLSFKYQVLNEDSRFARFFPPLGDLYFNYTQTSIWNLEAESKPFHDTAYQPGFFFYERGMFRDLGWVDRIDLETGFRHESNGQDGLSSRSINIVYVRPTLTWYLNDDTSVVFSPKIYTYVDDSENPDIDRYRGYVDLLLGVTWGAHTLKGTFRRGTHHPFGSIQLDYAYPLSVLSNNGFTPYLHLQYFNGWGESILDYDRKNTSQVRIGLMLIP